MFNKKFEDRYQYTSNDFVVKLDKSQLPYLLWLIIVLVPCATYIRYKKMGSSFTNGLGTFIFPFAIIMVILLFIYHDKKARIVISNEGIWTKNRKKLDGPIFGILIL